jgi:DNA-binding NarL/FixJ family response regulator
MSTPPLSPRETSVLHFVAWGYTNKEIADVLSLSVKTIEAHKANGMRKMRVVRRADLVRHAVDLGWMAPGNAPADIRPSE